MVVTPSQQVPSDLFLLPIFFVFDIYNQPWQLLTFCSSSTVFVSLASCCALRMGEYPAWLLFQCLTASRYIRHLRYALIMANILAIHSDHSSLSLFYCAHWQTYVSGTLQFGYIDVTEGQIVVMGVMLISSLEDFLDIDIWMSSVSASWRITLTRKINCSLPALLLQSQPAGDPVWCCLWHLLHVQGYQSDSDINYWVTLNFFRRMEQLTKFSLGAQEKLAAQWR